MYLPRLRRISDVLKESFLAFNRHLNIYLYSLKQHP